MSTTTVAAIISRPSSPLGTHNTNLDRVDIPSHQKEIQAGATGFSFTFDYTDLGTLHPLWEWTMPLGADVALPEIDKLESELEETLQPKQEGLIKYDILKSPRRTLTPELPPVDPTCFARPNVDDLDEDEYWVLGSPYLKAVDKFEDRQERNNYLRNAQYKHEYESGRLQKRARLYPDESLGSSSDEGVLEIFDTPFANDGVTEHAKYYSSQGNEGVDDSRDSKDHSKDGAVNKDGFSGYTSEFSVPRNDDDSEGTRSIPLPGKGKWVKFPESLYLEATSSRRKRKLQELDTEDEEALGTEPLANDQIPPAAANNAEGIVDEVPQAHPAEAINVEPLTNEEHTMFLRDRYQIVDHWPPNHVWECPFPELQRIVKDGVNQCAGVFFNASQIHAHVDDHVKALKDAHHGEELPCPLAHEGGCKWAIRRRGEKMGPNEGLERHITQAHLKVVQLDCYACGGTIARRSRDQIVRHLFDSKSHERKAIKNSFPSVHAANITQDELAWKARRLQQIAGEGGPPA